jgi:hypothetical protein
MTSCDATWDTKATSVCDRQAFHPDGTPVSQSAPAARGETLIVYVFGLGATSPSAKTGAPSMGAVVANILGRSPVWAILRSEPLNALSSVARFFSQDDANDPGNTISFAGVTPEQIGLYQLNIPIPQSLQPLAACGGDIHANALLNIDTFQGTEGLGICVKP